MTGFDAHAIRAQFPILQREVNGHPLSYLDTAASAQKPRAVIDAYSSAAENSYANVHRGIHTLSNETTTAYERARKTVAAFLNAPTPDEIVFTKGATEAINLVAYGLAHRVKPGDRILLSVLEHHSNIVPWHFLRERHGAELVWIGLREDGTIDADQAEAELAKGAFAMALSAQSNVLGTVPNLARLCAAARALGALSLLDGCQAAVHGAVDVQALGCDFYAVSGHKLYGPTGIGALYGRTEALERLQPFNGGGEMIETVTLDEVTYNDPPHRFEAGTPPILEAIALGAAIDWMRALPPGLAEHEAALNAEAREGLRPMNGVTMHGSADSAVLSFVMAGAHPHDLAQILDRYGVAIRAGHHCCQPLMNELGVTATARASFGAYSTHEDVARFIEGVGKARKMLL